jgi:hypothetical protein
VTFQALETVRITFRGKTVNGEVLLASANSLSLTLVLDDYLGSYIKLMPLVWLNDGYVDLLQAEPVTIFRQQQT